MGENNCSSFRRESRNSGGADNKADPWRQRRARTRQEEDAIVPSDNPVCRTTKWILRVHEKYSAGSAIVFDTEPESRIHGFYMDALHLHLPWHNPRFAQLRFTRDRDTERERERERERYTDRLPPEIYEN